MAGEQQKVRWGIIGPGGIARAFAGGVADSEHCELVAVGSRNPNNPQLAENFPGVRVHDGYQALIADPDVDAIYIATPHPGHAEWAIKCAEGGKHVLCEKPIGLTAFQADAMFNAARKAGTFMGEAFMYRLHPQTRKLVELIKSGTIGEVRMVKSSFGFTGGFGVDHRLLANDLAGGGILDVGCYPASMVRLIAGAGAGKDFLDPVKVAGAGYLGERTGVDEWASAVLTFETGVIAEISCSVQVAQENVLRILGTEGRIEVKDFWFAGRDYGGVGTIRIVRPNGDVEEIEVEEHRHLYSFEADAAAEAIRAGRQEFAAPGMSWNDTLSNMRVLDKWRSDVGLTYNMELPENQSTTIRGDKLAVGPNPVPKRQIPGLSQPTSLVALGFEFFESFGGASILLDAFFERGGNLFDTAFIYGGGKTETFFGQWHTSRGLSRDQFVLIGKGAHSPLVYPDVISTQLDQSLDRLQTDFVDVYFMHRDNPDIPVGEFVDAMDAEVKAGRIKGPYGGSNWTRERLDEAMDYAKTNGKTPPAAMSNNFSLAELIKPFWAGCVAASDDEWKAWLKERQIPNFAWSSQGRGFFTEAAGRDKTDNSELVDAWYSDKNFGRRDRAIELGKELGRSPIHIALAYVLAQPFPVVPLIGPRRLVELEDSLSALDIQLTAEQVRWLEEG